VKRLLIGLALVAAACGGEQATGFDSGAPLTTTTALPPTTTTTLAPTTTTPLAVTETAERVALDGASLPRLGQAPDPAVGMVAPTAVGTDFDGDPVAIAPSGNYQLLMFLAHWCGHCQNEVEALGPYLEATTLPPNVEVLSVSTGVDENRPNYPPSEWLTAEAWSPPVLVDTADSAVGAAFGLNAYPFWVVLDPQGVVLARTAGSLPLESIEALFENLSALEG
jgi:thiol-disulfide isomerase/thioredoxin